MGIEWDHHAINSMVSVWTNQHANRLGEIAQTYVAGSFPLETSFATPDNLLGGVAGGEESLSREYGDASQDPEPWGWPTIMEAATLDG